MGMRDLPDDLVHYMTTFMDQNEIRKCTLVCKPWRDVLYNRKLVKPKCMLSTGSGMMRYGNPDKWFPLDLHPPKYICAKETCHHQCVSATSSGLLLIANKKNYMCSDSCDIFVTNPMTQSWAQLPPLPPRVRKLRFSISDGDVGQPVYKVVVVYYDIPANAYFLGEFHDGAKEWTMNAIDILPDRFIVEDMTRELSSVLAIERNRVYFVLRESKHELPQNSLHFIDLHDVGHTQMTEILQWEDSEFPSDFSIYAASLVICRGEILLVTANWGSVGILMREEHRWVVLSEMDHEVLNTDKTRNWLSTVEWSVEANCWEEEIFICVSGEYTLIYNMSTGTWSTTQLLKTNHAGNNSEQWTLIPFQFSYQNLTNPATTSGHSPLTRVLRRLRRIILPPCLACLGLLEESL